MFYDWIVLQSQFIEKGFKKTEDFEHNVVLLLFLLIALDKIDIDLPHSVSISFTSS